nr:hypothetical protein [Tanacetum cinerariifolium]
MRAHELQTISAYIDSCLENIDQFLNGFVNQPNEINMDDPEPDGGLVDIPLVSPFLDSDDDSDDGEVLSELAEYGNVGKLCQKSIWMDFGGNARDVGSIGEETDKTMTLCRSLLKNSFKVPGDGVAIPRDAVISYDQRC